MADDREWNRRSLLRGAAVAAGAAAAAPLLGETARAQAGGNDAATAAQVGSGDADALFKAGKFDAAARLYEAILQKDPKNMHAARQRGLIGLLGNQFPVAEKYLTMALKLAPTDNETNELLGDCYIRQDKFALSVPHWQAGGEVAYPKWFAAFSGTPYQIYGDIGRVPFLKLDPMPQVEASINGGPPKHLTFYTGAPNLSLTASVAKEAGLSPVASQKIDFEGSTIWTYYGVLDSFKLGGIELRNVPVGWSSTESGQDVDTNNDGLIGTWVFYHFLTTFDYAGQSLILRRPTPEAASKARADAARAGVKPLPMWLALDHYVHSTGSIAGVADSGPQVTGVNFGGSDEGAAVFNGNTAKQLRIRTDDDRPIQTFAHSYPATTYPCYPKQIRLGDAVANDIYCYSNPSAQVYTPWPYGTGFDVRCALFHPFWKPYNITLDFTGMNLYIAPGKAG